MKLQRYELEYRGGYDAYRSMEPDDCGDYVLWGDVEKLLRGISSCGTCEACRNAALTALGTEQAGDGT